MILFPVIKRQTMSAHLFDMNIARTDYYESQTKLNNAQLQKLKAEERCDKAIGTLTMYAMGAYLLFKAGQFLHRQWHKNE